MDSTSIFTDIEEALAVDILRTASEKGAVEAQRRIDQYSYDPDLQRRLCEMITRRVLLNPPLPRGE